MRVDSSVTNIPNNSHNNIPSVIKAKEIKSILFLGIRGDIKVSVDHDTGDTGKHTVDTFA
ncbi:MAG: hypothetical protein J7K04_05865 [Spirochaetales bacterium]|nr:hypothetical protein [Spirochaetales bacterium]